MIGGGGGKVPKPGLRKGSVSRNPTPDIIITIIYFLKMERVLIGTGSRHPICGPACGAELYFILHM